MHIHNKATSAFQLPDILKSKVKHQNKLDDNDNFNSHIKNMEAQARQRQFDNVDISRGQAKAKTQTYKPPRNAGNAADQHNTATEEVRGAEKTGAGKGGRLFEISLRDPWPADHPSRGDCDRFLEIFKETYHEVLSEMGLAPESGDFSSVVMSNKDFKEMTGHMVGKLVANPQAIELMTGLNIDFSDSKTGKAGAKEAKGAEAPAEAPAEGPGKSHGVEGPGDRKGGRLSEISLRDPWPADHPSRGDCDRFLEIFKETYHEVLAEMGLAPETGDFSSVVMSNKDFREMVRRMEEKLNANPEARELMEGLNVDSSEVRTKGGKAEADTFRDGSRLLFEMLRRKYQDGALAGENEPGLGFKDFYEPKTDNQEPPVTEKIVEDQAPRAEEAVSPEVAARIASALAMIDRALSNKDFNGGVAGIMLMGLAKAFRLDRGETETLAADYGDTFGDLAKAYSQVHDLLKMRCEEYGLDETAFDEHLSTLNKALDNAVKMQAVRSADLAFRSFECGTLIRGAMGLEDMFGEGPRNQSDTFADKFFKQVHYRPPVQEALGPAFDYTEYDIWNLDPQHMFGEAARNHSSIFTSKFLEVFQKDGYEAAIAAAREELMNMPVTASTSDISFKDLNVIINAANQGGFKNLDDLNNSDLSDIMKKHLEDEWLFLQHSLAEMKKELDVLVKEQGRLMKQRFEIRENPNLSEKEMEIQLAAIEERLGVIQAVKFDMKFKQPGIGSYRMYN